MTTRDIPLGLIDPSRDNPRKTYPQIPELAATIEGLGLLQNLVVYESDGRYEVKAGSRRLKAMHLLVEQNRPGWNLETPVSCRVLQKGREGDLEALVENIQRVNLPPWDDGAAFDKIVQNQGLTYEDIGKQIGKSREHIGSRVRLARGLSPQIIPILARIWPSGPNIHELGKLASFIDKDTLKPDHDRQRKFLEELLTHGVRTKGKRKKYRTRVALEDRIKKLGNMELPDHVQAIVDSILRYIDGEDLVLPAFTGAPEAFVKKHPEPYRSTELEASLSRLEQERSV